MKPLFKLFFMSLLLLVGIGSFSGIAHAQDTTNLDLQTVIVDTVKRTAREQTEKAISSATQKTLDTAAQAGKNLDDNIAGSAEKTIAEKVPFVHKNIFLPIDGWRIRQTTIWQRMVAEQEMDTTGQIPEPIKQVAKKLDTTSGVIPKKGNIEQIPDDEKLFASTDAINDAVAGTSINPEETLGKTYTIFLKLLLIIFNSRVLFYGLFILIVLGILSKILKLRSSE